MSIPVIERIAQDVICTLQTVTVERDWNVDLDVERPQARGTNWTNGKTVVYLGARIPEQDKPQQYEQFTQTIAVAFYVIEPLDSGVSLDTRLWTGAADIHKALCGTEAKRQRDGWAFDTVPGDVTPLERDFDSNEGGIIVEVAVRYRTTWGDPYSSPHRS